MPSYFDKFTTEELRERLPLLRERGQRMLADSVEREIRRRESAALTESGS